MPQQPGRSSSLVNAEWSALANWSTRAIMGNPCPWPLGETLSDIQAAQAFFQAEAIAPLCHHALQTAGAGELAPTVIGDFLRQKRLVYAAIELVRAHQDAGVMHCLAKIGLQPLVLKGTAYAQTLYPEALLRPRCDTDLLFPDRESAQKAWTHLEEEGYARLSNVVEGRYVSRQATVSIPSCDGACKTPPAKCQVGPTEIEPSYNPAAFASSKRIRASVPDRR